MPAADACVHPTSRLSYKIALTTGAIVVIFRRNELKLAALSAKHDLIETLATTFWGVLKEIVEPLCEPRERLPWSSSDGWQYVEVRFQRIRYMMQCQKTDIPIGILAMFEWKQLVSEPVPTQLGNFAVKQVVILLVVGSIIAAQTAPDVHVSSQPSILQSDQQEIVKGTVIAYDWSTRYYMEGARVDRFYLSSRGSHD